MELFKLLGTIAIDNQKALAGIDDTTDKAEKAEGKIGNAFKKIGAVTVKAMAAATTAAATGIAAITKSAVASYADYEQLVGGVETLFKESSGKVQGYADNAYKTAGLSANEYMETVTSFSASLLQSLNGDTAKAAEVADKAITDMSDNANKMGSSMESIQNAYQGFAKQNYTMLDNLKLGYGGTKEEMERLLADAEKLSGQKFDLSSYADVVEAIHVVQTEMGITGTTAKEAATTIQGSIASMKGAWKNLLVGIADGNQDMHKLVKNLGENIVTVAENMIPRIQTVLQSIGTLIQTVVPPILQKLPPMLMQVLPSLLSAAVSLVKSIVSTALSALQEYFPQLLQGGADMIDNIADGLSENMPSIIEKGLEIITSLVTSLIENAPELLKAAAKLILSLAEGLVKSIPSLLESVLKVVSSVTKTILDGGWLSIGGKIITKLKEGFSAKSSAFISAVSSTFTKMKDTINSKIESAKNVVKKGVEKLKSFFNFKWSLPKIKLPHFKITGKFSLDPPSIPHFGVEWYKQGAVLTQPTLFGVNPATGNAMAGGEAGAEAVAPIDVLQNYVKTAVQGENDAVVSKLDELIALLTIMLQQIINSSGSQNLVIDGDTLIGWIDKRMAQSQNLQLRGV